MSRTMSRRMRRYAVMTVIAVVPIAILCAYVANLLAPTAPLPRPVSAASYNIIETASINDDSSMPEGNSLGPNFGFAADASTEVRNPVLASTSPPAVVFKKSLRVAMRAPHYRVMSNFDRCSSGSNKISIKLRWLVAEDGER